MLNLMTKKNVNQAVSLKEKSGFEIENFFIIKKDRQSQT